MAQASSAGRASAAIGSGLRSIGAAGGQRLAVGEQGLLQSNDRDLDHVVGRLLRGDHLDPDPRLEDRG